jgi:hypothetical protein
MFYFFGGKRLKAKELLLMLEVGFNLLSRTIFHLIPTAFDCAAATDRFRFIRIDHSEKRAFFGRNHVFLLKVSKFKTTERN